MEGLSEFEQEVQEELEAAGACIYVKMGSNQTWLISDEILKVYRPFVFLLEESVAFLALSRQQAH